MVETIPILRTIFLRNRAFGRGIIDARAIREEEVEPAIVIVIEEGNARAHGFEQVFLRGRRRRMFEMDTEFLGHVDKSAGGGSIQCRMILRRRALS